MKMQRRLVLWAVATAWALGAQVPLKFVQGKKDSTLHFSADVGDRFPAVKRATIPDFPVPIALKGLVKPPAQYSIEKGQLKIDLHYVATPGDEPLSLTFTIKDAAKNPVTFIANGTLKADTAGSLSAPPPAKQKALISLSGLDVLGDGTGKSVTATTIPENLPVVIRYDGVLTKPSAVGTHRVAATVNTPLYEGSALETMTIRSRKEPATVYLSDLQATYDGKPKAITVTTEPAGRKVIVTYGGRKNLPINPGNYSVEARIVDPAYEGSATETMTINPGEVPWWKDPLVWIVGVGCVVLAVLALIFWIYPERSEKKHRERQTASLTDGSPAQNSESETPRVGAGGGYLGAVSAGADPRPQPDVSGESSRKALEEIAQLRKELEEAIDVLSKRIGRWGSEPDMDKIVGAVVRVPKRPPNRSAPAATDEQRLASCVNSWLKTGGGDRQKLLERARDVYLDAELYTHRDIAKSLSELKRFAYRFEPSTEEGGWIWVPVQDSNHQLAIPADLAFFQIGQAPELLDRLFEGMRSATSGFRFDRFYRPCRLKPVPGEPGMYERVSPGAVLLVGGDPPSLSEPPGYESLERRSSSATAGASGGTSVARALAEGFQRLREEATATRNDVTTMTSTLKSVQENMRELKAIAESKRPAEVVTKHLDLDYKALNEKIADLEKSNSDLGKKYGELSDQAVRVAKQAQIALDRVTKLTEAPAIQQTEAKSSESPSPNRKPSPPLPLGSGTNAPAARPTRDSGSPGPVKGVLSLPAGWDDAVNGISSDADDPENPQTSFVRRLQSVADSLRKLNSSDFSVGLVHLKVDSEEFEVHQTGLSDNEDVICQTCKTTQSFQLAVCMAKPGVNEIFILFAPGAIVPRNYLAGYKALIEDCPSTPFRIGRVGSPARLKLREGEISLYGVEAKLRWTE